MRLLLTCYTGGGSYTWFAVKPNIGGVTFFSNSVGGEDPGPPLPGIHVYMLRHVSPCLLTEVRAWRAAGQAVWECVYIWPANVEEKLDFYNTLGQQCSQHVP